MNNKINEDLRVAMKNKDAFKLSVLRMLKSALQLEKIAKKQELTDNDVQIVIKKQVKLRKDSINEYQKYGKTESVSSLEEEIAILSAYIPEELSEDVIKSIVLDTIKEINPSGMKEMGKVMKSVNDKLTSQNADMSLVSKLVKEELSKIN